MTTVPLEYVAPLPHRLQQGGVFMVGKHEIYLGNEVIGQASVSRQGLYYHIVCKCSLTGKVVYRVVASWTDRVENLGILVPSDGVFMLSSRVPAKRVGEGQVTFQILPKHEKIQENFIPIRAEEPFAYLSALENAYLRVSGGAVGMVIREAPASAPPGSDPNP